MDHDRDFREVNEYVYHSAHGAVLDAVIWCLGPLADDRGEYPRYRILLALATRFVLRPFVRPVQSSPE